MQSMWPSGRVCVLSVCTRTCANIRICGVLVCLIVLLFRGETVPSFLLASYFGSLFSSLESISRAVLAFSFIIGSDWPSSTAPLPHLVSSHLSSWMALSAVSFFWQWQQKLTEISVWKWMQTYMASISMICSILSFKCVGEAQSVKPATSAQVMISGLWFQAPCQALCFCADSSEPGACFGLCVFLFLPLPRSRAHALSLCLKNK